MLDPRRLRPTQPVQLLYLALTSGLVWWTIPALYYHFDEVLHRCVCLSAEDVTSDLQKQLPHCGGIFVKRLPLQDPTSHFGQGGQDGIRCNQRELSESRSQFCNIVGAESLDKREICTSFLSVETAQDIMAPAQKLRYQCAHGRSRKEAHNPANHRCRVQCHLQYPPIRRTPPVRLTAHVPRGQTSSARPCFGLFLAGCELMVNANCCALTLAQGGPGRDD